MAAACDHHEPDGQAHRAECPQHPQEPDRPRRALGDGPRRQGRGRRLRRPPGGAGGGGGGGGAATGRRRAPRAAPAPTAAAAARAADARAAAWARGEPRVAALPGRRSTGRGHVLDALRSAALRVPEAADAVRRRPGSTPGGLVRRAARHLRAEAPDGAGAAAVRRHRTERPCIGGDLQSASSTSTSAGRRGQSTLRRSLAALLVEQQGWSSRWTTRPVVVNRDVWRCRSGWRRPSTSAGPSTRAMDRRGRRHRRTRAAAESGREPVSPDACVRRRRPPPLAEEALAAGR